jgi:hypothetical protein
MKTLKPWGPWEDNPSKPENFYGKVEESTQLEPNLNGEIDIDTHKLLKKDQNKDDDELETLTKEITESYKEWIGKKVKIIDPEHIGYNKIGEVVSRVKYKHKPGSMLKVDTEDSGYLCDIDQLEPINEDLKESKTPQDPYSDILKDLK